LLLCTGRDATTTIFVFRWLVAVGAVQSEQGYLNGLGVDQNQTIGWR
jgi:hypothetical protein